MDEKSFKFWIIPIVCLVLIVFVFSFAFDHKINTVLPNAAIEREEMKSMSCPEILLKDSLNDYWTPENGKMGREKIPICKELMKSESSGLSPYVEFCNPGGFAPIKKIENKTHLFNHDRCLWDPMTIKVQ